mmetsp:Transcript_26605/g.76693  ORF Transcript_26605/g.76693 Transcript_26605/m.76693 type:complete len:170 (+) Transcript_26605:68-577(+)|eukprot:CAMPEP_0168459870 /NCGR_PEP_ID=MMETSP0228-20121227/53146_1 /TAXON_ID=133427 /ORGANISM="Protoceratium reticulatum, Strain CCCM 535 (=CCMP 1889)" /LENGTH=169 /DNA_ID=CAMNT_0008475075 /DNA_START=69 /DNA_END=578 /DNA_ORIENTATION=-
MSFAANLTKIVADKKAEQSDREKVATKWSAYEGKLIDQAVELFKQRCLREAEQQKCEATISFEVLSREIEDFPKRILTDSTYFVDTWGDGLSAESWFYATRGLTASWSPGAPVLFAEVLQGMLPKFVERVKSLGFLTCNHEAGTWKVTVCWQAPEDQPPSKRRRGPEGA